MTFTPLLLPLYPRVPVACRKVAQRGSQSTSKCSSVIPPDVVCAFSSASRDRKHADASPLILDLPAVKKLERLPSNARIADPFLTNLIMLCRLEGVPLLLIAREGYRATGAELSRDGTGQVRRWQLAAGSGHLGVCQTHLPRWIVLFS